MVELLKPKRGGFLRPFGCGWFVREYLTSSVDSKVGAPQADIFYHYKMALRQATALDRATRAEEKKARREKRSIDPESIERLTERYLSRLPYKATGCRYHSFVTYFSTLQRLSWVEATGEEEPSSFQSNYPSGPPRRYYRLTQVGYQAGDAAWANPHSALYGRR